MAETRTTAKATRWYVETPFGPEADRQLSNWLATRSPVIDTQAKWNAYVNAATLPANNLNVDPRLLQIVEFIAKNSVRFPSDPRPDEP